MSGAIHPGYRRYVAIGDSQTEGLWDGDDSTGLLGFADRLAAMLDSAYPGLQYANLAIRGKRIGHVLAEQVPAALAMRPDLITVCAGMNDVIQPGRSFGPALTDLDHIYAALAGSGATVVTTTFPNVAQFLPLGRLVAGRLTRINAAIRAPRTGTGSGWSTCTAHRRCGSWTPGPSTGCTPRPRGTSCSRPRPPRR